MDADEILDGFALWDEHKPQSGEDWIAVARRSVEAKDYDPKVGSPLFQGLYAAVEALMDIADASRAENADPLEWATWAHDRARAAIRDQQPAREGTE